MRKWKVKVISHTEQIFGVLGDRKKTILYYEDGSKKIIDHSKKLPLKKTPKNINS